MKDFTRNGNRENENKEQKHLLNRQIRELRVMLLDKNGEKIGDMSTAEALHRAEEQELDLVLISKPATGLPVCKILDYGSWQYHEKKKKDAQTANNKTQELKELWISPAVGDSDLNIKLKKVQEFLKDGHKVRVIVKPTKGKKDQNRLMYNYQSLEVLVNKVINALSEVSSLENDLKISTGQSFGFVLKPEKKQATNKMKV